MRPPSRAPASALLILGLALTACGGGAAPASTQSSAAPASSAATKSAASSASTSAAATSAAPSSASAQSSASTAASPSAAAKPGGKLSVYSALNESTNNAFVAAFKKANPGVDVDVLPLAAAGELQTRIQTEKNSPKASRWSSLRHRTRLTRSAP